MKKSLALFLMLAFCLCTYYAVGADMPPGVIKLPEVGSNIEVEMNNGEIVKGKFEKITLNKIYVDINGSVTVGLRRKDISLNSQQQYFKDDFDKNISKSLPSKESPDAGDKQPSPGLPWTVPSLTLSEKGLKNILPGLTTAILLPFPAFKIIFSPVIFMLALTQLKTLFV